MARLGVRWKLTLWYGVVLALLLTAFSGTVYWTMRHHLLKRIDHGLTEELADVRFEVERAADGPGLLVWLERRFARHEGFDFQITRPDGTRFFVSDRMAERSLPRPAEERPEAVFETVTLAPSSRSRVVSVQVRGPEGSLTVQIARSLAAYEHESEELLWAFLLAGPLTVLATLAGGYFLARRTLAPVQQMTETARQISGERLDKRVTVSNAGDELGQLAATFNDMLDRLERSFNEMRRFTADAAHELRTPLAVIRSEAEVALRTPRSGDEYARVLETMLEEVTRLGVVADQLLFLCRQDAGLLLPAREEVAIAETLREVVGNMQLVGREKGVEVELVDVPPIRVASDSRLIRRVLYNLLDNAIKHTGPAGRVSVSAAEVGGSVQIRVSDTGCGIPPEHLPRVFDRFYRGDPSRTGDGGAGLGLSICRSIAAVLGGTVALTSTVGKGTTAELSLPAALEQGDRAGGR